MLAGEDDHIGTPSEGDEKSGTTFDSIGESGGTPNLTLVRAVIGAIAAVVNSSRQSLLCWLIYESGGCTYLVNAGTHSPANTGGRSLKVTPELVLNHDTALSQ